MLSQCSRSLCMRGAQQLPLRDVAGMIERDIAREAVTECMQTVQAMQQKT
jgi:hypothetical protein